MTVGGSIEELRDVLAIVLGRLPWREHEQSRNVIQAMRAEKSFKALLMLCADSPERMRDLMNLINEKDDRCRTKVVLVKLCNCHLLTLLPVLFGVLRLDSIHLHWMHLFFVGGSTQ